MNLSILAKRRAIAYAEIEDCLSQMTGTQVVLPSHRDFQVQHLQRTEAIAHILSSLIPSNKPKAVPPSPPLGLEPKPEKEQPKKRASRATKKSA